MFYKQQLLFFFFTFGLYVMVPADMKTRSQVSYRTPSASLSDDDFRAWLRYEIVRLPKLWRKNNWSIARKKIEIQNWGKATMPKGLDAVDEDGEETLKMRIWRDAYAKLRRDAIAR